MNFAIANAAKAQVRSVFRPDIEGLRALAVLSVTAFHFSPATLGGGFVGVDIFFVISGYLITSHLLTELERSDRIDFAEFYVRRIRRLLPASLLVTIAILIASWFVLSPLEQLQAAKSGISAVLFVSNLWFLRQTYDYFSPEMAQNPFLHMWSLAVEEQFYLIWPLLLLLIWRLLPGRRGLIGAMAALLLLSFGACIVSSQVRQPWAFYGTPFRAWEFAIGGLFGCSRLPRLLQAPQRREALLAAAALVLGLSAALMSEAMVFPGWIAAVPALASGLILWGGGGGEESGSVGRLLGSSPLQWVGRRSYSIYLWHWPAIVLIGIVIPRESITAIALAGVVTLVGAAASYEMVENPVRASDWLKRSKARSAGFGVAIVATGAAAGLIAALTAMHFDAAPAQRTNAVLAAEDHAASGRAGGNCLVGLLEEQPQSCIFGDPASTTTIVLIGDSHADQWSTALDPIARDHHWRLVTLLKSSCALSDIASYSVRLRRDWPECTRWRERALRKAIEFHPRLVVFSQFSSGYVAGSISKMGPHGVSVRDWAAGLDRTLDIFGKAGIPALAIADPPTPNVNVRNCVARALWWGREPAGCDFPGSRAAVSGLREAEARIVSRHRLARLVDVYPLFCRAGRCAAQRGGRILYRDPNHLTADQVRTLGPVIEQRLVQALDRTASPQATASLPGRPARTKPR